MKLVVVGERSQLAKSFTKFCSNFVESIEVIVLDHRIYLKDNTSLCLAIFEHNPNAVLYFPAISDEAYISLHEDYAREINSELAIRISNACSKHSVQFISFSTTKVFDEKVGKYSNFDSYSFTSNYGRMKSEMEVGVIKNHGTVLRLSKIMDYDYSLWQKWRNHLNSGVAIEVQRKYYVAPVLLQDVNTAILKLINLRQSGLFQLSNKDEISFEKIFNLYVDAFNLQMNKLLAGHMVNFLDKPVRHSSLLSSSIFDDPIMTTELIVLNSLHKSKNLLR